MANKTIKFDTFMLSTDKHRVFKRETVYTNDKNSAELNFNVKDIEDLTSHTPQVLLYMRDGSFFQISEGVTKDGTVVKYTLKDNEGKHGGLARTQLVLIAGESELASAKFEFNIESGLGGVASEVMIQDWSTLLKTARDYIDDFIDGEAARQTVFETNEAARQRLYDDLVNTGVLQSNIDTKLAELEEEYAPAFANVTAQLAQKAQQSQVDTFEARMADVIQSADLDPNKDQEIVDARLGETTLATKLGVIDNKLSKIDSRFENKITNGNFEQDATGWIAGNRITYGSTEKALIGGKSAKIVQDTSFSLARQDVAANIGDKLYVRASLFIDSYIAGGIFLRCTDYGWTNTNATFTGFDMTKISEWQTRSMIRTCANEGSNIQVGSTTNATYTAYADAVMTINLTQVFGAGNEPTKEEMDELISFFPEEWFDGKAKPDKTQMMFIDMLLSDIKNKGDNVNSDNGKYVYVSSYGTDSAAIQSAFDDANGRVVVFDSGTTYDTSVSLNLSLDSVRGIVGNNAVIKVNQDITALKVTGNFPPTLSADPDRFEDNSYGEMNMFIDNLRITCGKTLAEESEFIGTAIELSQTFGVSMRGCHFYKLKHGIRFKNKNRNFIFTGNHIYYILGNGITFAAGSDLHQVNLTANHISYFKKGIHFEPTSYVFNLQVVGNDLESSKFPVGAESIIHAEGILLEVEIVGNTIQDHEILTMPQMFFANEVRQVHIVGNTFGNSSNGIIKLVGGGQIVIGNNSANGGVGRFLEFALELNTMGVVVNGNSTRDLDFIKVSSVVAGVYIENSQIYGNVTHNAKNLPTAEFVDTDLREFTFNNNSIMVHSNYGDVTKPVVSLKTTPVRTSRFSGNTLRGTNKAKNAMDIQPTSTYRTIISDNIAYQVTDVNYILPVASANNVIVKDNI